MDFSVKDFLYFIGMLITALVSYVSSLWAVKSQVMVIENRLDNVEGHHSESRMEIKELARVLTSLNNTLTRLETKIDYMEDRRGH